MPEYRGPGAGEMIAKHTLVTEIIAHNDGPDDERILDDKEVSFLRQFCTLPSPADKEARAALLKQHGLGDVPLAPPGPEIQTKGSLVGYLVATYDFPNAPLREDEVQRLQKWFGEK